MTREEAIKIIDCYDIGFYDLSGEKIPADKLADAFDMAIEALQREEAEEKGWCHRIRPKNVEVVVRCKDCKHKYVEGKNTRYYWCRINDRPVDDTDYCVWAERGNNEQIGY